MVFNFLFHFLLFPHSLVHHRLSVVCFLWLSLPHTQKFCVYLTVKMNDTQHCCYAVMCWRNGMCMHVVYMHEPLIHFPSVKIVLWLVVFSDVKKRYFYQLKE